MGSVVGSVVGCVVGNVVGRVGFEQSEQLTRYTLQCTGAQCSILGSVGALGSVLGTANGQCGEYFG